MTFREEEVDAFLAVFEKAQPRIAAFEGCQKAELLRCKDRPNIFFTHSIWENTDCLESYRHSELFKTTWKATKALFAERAEAWSVEKIK